MARVAESSRGIRGDILEQMEHKVNSQERYYPFTAIFNYLMTEKYEIFKNKWVLDYDKDVDTDQCEMIAQVTGVSQDIIGKLKGKDREELFISHMKIKGINASDNITVEDWNEYFFDVVSEDSLDKLNQLQASIDLEIND